MVLDLKTQALGTSIPLMLGFLDQKPPKVTKKRSKCIMIKVEAFLPENGEGCKRSLDLLVSSCIPKASPSSSSSKTLNNAHKWLTSSWKALGFRSGLERALRRLRECYNVL